MPRLSTFYGILITMNFGDHAPPHVHARYGEFTAVVGIDPIEVLRGHLPPRAEGFVLEWAAMHRVVLAENWARASRFQPTSRIAPLD